MPKRILVVDDDPTVLFLCKERLVKGGYQVETASNGEVAMHILKRAHIDAILTDVVMPKMDGVDFYKELKKDMDLMNIPVIIITENPRYRELFMQLGVARFIEKPIHPDRLLSLFIDLFRDLSGHGKILISGNDPKVVEVMGNLIEGAGYKAALAGKGVDLMSIALTITPAVVLLDVLQDDVPTREVIEAMKCFMRFKNTKILTYTVLAPEEMSDVDAVEQLKEAKDACNTAGATKYIGRFSETNFVSAVLPFLEGS